MKKLIAIGMSALLAMTPGLIAAQTWQRMGGTGGTGSGLFSKPDPTNGTVIQCTTAAFNISWYSWSATTATAYARVNGGQLEVREVLSSPTAVWNGSVMVPGSVDTGWTPLSRLSFAQDWQVNPVGGTATASDYANRRIAVSSIGFNYTVDGKYTNLCLYTPCVAVVPFSANCQAFWP